MIPTGAIAEVKKTFELCLQRFPTIQLSFEDYLAHIDEIVVALQSPSLGKLTECRAWLAVFAHLHGEDVFLAFACSRGDRIAWEYFADDYAPLLRRYALQACRSFNESEDLAQELITRLMEGKEKLAGYNGRASLAGWLRVAIANAAVDRFRRARKQVSLEAVEDGQPVAKALDERIEEDADERLDARWGPVLSEALAGEIGRLAARDRLLLNLYYVQAVPLKLIGQQFRVHEATVSRRLESLRREIRKRIEKELRARHGLRPREIQSLWHWVSESDGLPIEKAMSQ